MAFDAKTEIFFDPIDFGALLEPKPKNFSITVIGSSLHKKDILETHVPPQITVDMLSPKVSPLEPNYVTGIHLIKKKANDLYAVIEKEGRVQGPEEVWVANDINSAIDIAGAGNWEPMRKFTDIDKYKPHEEQMELLVDHINEKFNDLEDDTIYTVRIEALSAWRFPKGIGLVVLNERGYIQLPPGIIEKLRDSEFIKNYLDYCKTVQKTMREVGENPGARNLNAPWGIRWDDLLSFVGYEEPTEAEPWLSQGIHLNVRTVPGQSERDGFNQHIRGFSAVMVQDALPIVSDILKHPQKLKKRLLYLEREPKK